MVYKYEDKICEAIGTIVEQAVSSAGYDRTIQAVVSSCSDATIGKYKIKYQDSLFYAYATNPDITYTKGTNVYILIPGNDMTKDKIILGTVGKLANNTVYNDKNAEGAVTATKAGDYVIKDPDPQTYVTAATMEQLLATLSNVLNGTLSSTWNENIKTFTFTFTPNEPIITEESIE